MADIITGQIYRHFKGNLYRVITLAEHSETGEQMVVYQALYGENKVYVRPARMFTEPVDRTKYPDAPQEFRFEIWDGLAAVPGAYAPAASAATAAPKREPAGSERTGSQAMADRASAAERTPDMTDRTSSADASGIEKKEPERALAEPEETPEEPVLDPRVSEFLDTKDFSEKLRILQTMKNSVTDPMIDTMAFSIDIELHDGPVEARYKELLGCVALRERFENSRLRS
ncbi:MAG: DUF1653 domain-containing protein [Lachnospiraceae bacterium]|nr:DUF1653 domain-containing protein [Lachnospiraceae bacterium]